MIGYTIQQSDWPGTLTRVIFCENLLLAPTGGWQVSGRCFLVSSISTYYLDCVMPRGVVLKGYNWKGSVFKKISLPGPCEPCDTASNDGIPRRLLPEAPASLQLVGTSTVLISLIRNLIRASFFLRKQPFYKASSDEKMV